MAEINTNHPKLDVSFTYEQMGKKAAQQIAKMLRTKPDAVIGLATGSTPRSTYQELIRIHREEGVDFSKATFFNLDEYIGLEHDHPQSYHYYMKHELFDHINVDTQKINIPDGMAKNLEEECISYEAKIKEATQGKGIDLLLLGIGPDPKGHIGFNEVGTPFDSITHIADLDKTTREANKRFFGNDISQVPKQALTMGLKTITDSQKIILIANNENKSESVFEALTGEVTTALPASILQNHKDTTFYVDTIAAKSFKEYFSFHELMKPGR